MRNRISAVRFQPAAGRDVATGLEGWIRFVIDGDIRVDGVALRRLARGGFGLSFPERVDRVGRRHAVIAPLTDEARRDIEAAVFEQLGLEVEPSAGRIPTQYATSSGDGR